MNERIKEQIYNLIEDILILTKAKYDKLYENLDELNDKEIKEFLNDLKLEVGLLNEDD